MGRPTTITQLTLAAIAAISFAACAPSDSPAPANATATLAPDNEPGQRMIVTGAVKDTRGRPIAGATLHVFHQDSSGRYVREHKPERLEARLRTGSDGAYRFSSVVPGDGEGAAHVHFEVSARGHDAQSFAMGVPRVPDEAARTTMDRPIAGMPTTTGRPDLALLRRLDSAGAFTPENGIPPGISGAPASRRDSAGVVFLHYDIRLR